MEYPFLDKLGLRNVMAQINVKLGRKVDKVNGKGLSTNDYTNEDKIKLTNISANAEENQNAFSFIKVGSNFITADEKSDIIEFEAGDNISITGSDNKNDKITIAVTGLGTAAFKNINDFDAAGAASDVLGTSSDLSTADTVYGAKAAALAAQDKADIAKSTADAAMPKSGGTFTGSVILQGDPSTNLEAATKQYVDSTVGGKVDKVSGKGLSTNDYTTDEKNKLNSIDSGAQVNQNAFSKIEVGDGTNTIIADIPTDTFKILNGDNINIIANNDTIIVNVTGLGSAAFKNINDFDVAGAASDVLGTADDNSNMNTVYGAKAAASEALNSANAAKSTADAAMPKSGGTFTGRITLSADPSSSLEPATKQYVDSKLAGVSGVMHFKGIKDELPTNNSEYTDGDVIGVGLLEYIFSDGEWHQFGDEGSFVLRTQTINGHVLNTDITLSASDVGAEPVGTASALINDLTHTTIGSGNYVADVVQENGKITVTKSTLPTTLPNTYALNIKNASGSIIKTYTGSSTVDISAADLGALTQHQDISGKQDTLSWITNNDIDAMFAGTYVVK